MFIRLSIIHVHYSNIVHWVQSVLFYCCFKDARAALLEVDFALKYNFQSQKFWETGFLFLFLFLQINMHTMLITDFSGTYCPRCWAWDTAPLFLAAEAHPPAGVTPPQCRVSSADGTWLFGYAELMHTDAKHISKHRSESREFPPRPAVKRATDRKTR